MRRQYRFAWWLGLAVLLAAPVGCGGGAAVYPVKGKVTLEGKPMVGGGSIAFVPTGTQAGKAAGGRIAPDGTYELTTNRPGDGSMVGEFRVLITQEAEKEPAATRDGEKPAVATSIDKADRIPRIYSTPDKSPLKATVEAKTEPPNQINFDLKRNADPPEEKAPVNRDRGA